MGQEKYASFKLCALRLAACLAPNIPEIFQVFVLCSVQVSSSSACVGVKKRGGGTMAKTELLYPQNARHR